MNTAYRLLRRLGFRTTYLGYDYLAQAIMITVNDPRAVRNVIKRIYVPLSLQYGVSKTCVESAIRKSINAYWDLYEDSILSTYTGYPLKRKPSTGEMIGILADCILEHPDEY